MAEKVKLHDQAGIAAGIVRMADGVIAEFDPGHGDDFVLVGVYKQGVPLAERLRREIHRRTGYLAETGMLDISMYRDDFGLRSGLPLIRETVIPFDLNDNRVIIVDDVLSSGRTIRAALDALTDYGRPALIRLAVLIDRGHPEYPIHSDYAGIHADVSDEFKLMVELEENDGVDAVYQVQWS
jgi:pyrimidine operon attenuation protein/uracil phosphoribosyltransferase